MSARVFIHPRCTVEPGEDRLMTNLLCHSIDITKVRAFLNPRGYHELVRFISGDAYTTTYERWDGVQFTRSVLELGPQEAA